MLADYKLPITFWAEAVSTACYMQNRATILKEHNKTPYELLFKRKPHIHFVKAFRCPCSILNTRDRLSKFDAKAEPGYFVGYSSASKAYRVYNPRSDIVDENPNVTFNEHSFSTVHTSPDWLFDIDSFTKFFNEDYHLKSSANELPVFEVITGCGYLKPMRDYSIDHPQYTCAVNQGSAGDVAATSGTSNEAPNEVHEEADDHNLSATEDVHEEELPNETVP
jgi:hypothetical protein